MHQTEPILNSILKTEPESIDGGLRRDLNPAFTQASVSDAFQAPQAFTAFPRASVRFQVSRSFPLYVTAAVPFSEIFMLAFNISIAYLILADA